MTLSRDKSATKRFSLPFSSRSCFSSRASLGSIPAVVLLPPVERLLRDPDLAAHVADRQAPGDLLQQGRDLLHGKTPFLHGTPSWPLGPACAAELPLSVDRKTPSPPTGMRRGELRPTRRQGVALETGSVHIRRDKAGDERWTVMSSEALRIVRALKRRKIASPLVFCTPFGKSLRTNFQRVWETARRRAKITNFRFHDLRHTFASRLTQRRVDSYVIQRAGGWRTPIMMQRYAHL